ncbi:MAG: hypothetical protein NTW19_06115 [Planctomycetota bacterium]|nr:hypothetical protein [Planctomycetota bacterium]
MNRSLLVMLALAWIACLAAPALAAKPHSFTIQDYIGVEWKNEPVHFHMEFAKGEFEGAATASAKIEGGAAVPCQVADVSRHWDGSVRSLDVWLMATIPVHGQVTYVITPGGKPAEKAGEAGAIGKEADGKIEMTSAPSKGVGLVLPSGSKKYFSAESSTVPAPIQGLILPSGRRTDPGHIDAPLRIMAYEATLLDQGPVFARAAVRYTFENGYWAFTARVFRDTPMILIDEELDTGDSKLAWDKFDRFLSVPLQGKDFKPAQVFFGSRNEREDLQDIVKNAMPALAIKTPNLREGWYSSPIHGFTTAGKLDKPDEFYYLSGYSSVLSRVGMLMRVVEPGKESIGVAGLRTGQWRNPMSLRLATTGKGDLLLRLPLQSYDQGWNSDGFGRYSQNYTGKTVGVPATTARRSYGIMISPAEDEKQAELSSLFAAAERLGAHPLDDVKDWTLEWPDPMAKAAWAKETSAAGKEALELMRARTVLTRAQGNMARFSMAYHFGFAKSEYPVVLKVINSTADLTAADRQELRRLVAFHTYDMNSPDTFPWGMGFHLNNPNMTIMACEGRIKAGLLIRDHPMFKTWGEYTLELVKEYNRRFTRESGALYENPHYALGVTLDWQAQVNQILIDAGIGDAFDNALFRRSLVFAMNWLSPPDPRFLGHRTLVPWGNASYQSIPPTMAQQYVSYYKTRDVKFAGELEWSANQTLPDDKKIKEVPEVVPQLGSAYFPEYGVAFRHGFGTPYETLFYLMAGNCDGHYEWEADQMCYTLYAKGQPINMHFGNGYFPMLCRPWMRNRVSIDHKYEISERNPTQVLTASFGPDAEYLHATRDVDQIRPLETEHPLETPNGAWAPEEQKSWPARPTNIETIPMTTWHRQVLFLSDPDPKGPNYFAIRDAFSGTPTKPTDLSFWFLANKMEKQGNVFHYDGQCKADMDVFVATPAPGTFEPGTDQYHHRQQPYVRLVGFDPAYHPDGKLGETQIALRINQPAGKGYLTVLYPRLKENDPPATFARLDDNVVRVETPASTDYIFMSPFSFAFKDDKVQFKGEAGTVRFYKSGKWTATSTQGTATIVVNGKTITGQGAFTVTVEGGQATVKPLSPKATAEVK